MNTAEKNDQKALAAQIKNLSSEVAELEKTVYAKMDSPEEDSKRIPFYFCQPVSFKIGETTLRESTYVNEAEDVSIMAMTYSVVTSAPQVSDAFTLPKVAPRSTPYWNSTGVLNSGVTLLTPPITPLNPLQVPFLFDFDWNFRTKQGTVYMGGGAVSDGRSFLLHRTALGFPERGDMLRFNRPQVLKAGESLVLTVKPTLYAHGENVRESFSSYVTDPIIRKTVVTVNMICIGFRDGRMAWPTVRV